MSSRSNRLQLSCGRGTYDKDGRAVTRYFCLLSNSYTHATTAKPIDTPPPLADSRTCNPIRPNFRDESIFEGRRIQAHLRFFWTTGREWNGSERCFATGWRIEAGERERREGSYDNVYKSVHANVQTRSSFRSAITPTHSAHHTTKKLSPCAWFRWIPPGGSTGRRDAEQPVARNWANHGEERSQRSKATVCSLSTGWSNKINLRRD